MSQPDQVAVVLAALNQPVRQYSLQEKNLRICRCGRNNVHGCLKCHYCGGDFSTDPFTLKRRDWLQLVKGRTRFRFNPAALEQQIQDIFIGWQCFHFPEATLADFQEAVKQFETKS